MTSRSPTRTAAARCSSSSPPRAGTSSSTGDERRHDGAHQRAEVPALPAPERGMTLPRSYAVVLPAYLAGLLALDTQVSFNGQLALGALTFAVLAVALRPLAPLVRGQAVGVV